MLRIDIATIALDPKTEQPVLILKPASSPNPAPRILPITLGHPEATAILMALQGVHFPRPMTHDLLAGIMDSLDVRLIRVEINDFDKGTFFAALTLEQGDEEYVVDARPSDAIALAVRMKAPVFIEEDIFALASVEIESLHVEELRSAAEIENEIDTFREFIDHVVPTDFHV